MWPQLIDEGGDADQSKSTVETSETKEDITTRLTKLVNSAPVMLFMKGVPSKPQCGFSSKIVDILNKEKITFASFNILSDEEVRQGLKV